MFARIVAISVATQIFAFGLGTGRASAQPSAGTAAQLSRAGAPLEKPATVAAPLPLPPQESTSGAGRFAAAWLAGAAGSFGGGYLGCLAACLDDGDDLRLGFLGLGVGSAVGSGVLAGAVNGHIARGLLGGVVGFGAGLGAMWVADQVVTDGGGLPIAITGAVVQGLFAAAFSAIGK